jgi:hypothetical protein
VSKQSRSIRVSLDDAICQDGLLKVVDHVTSKELDIDQLKSMNFSEEELADLGNYVYARLSAFLECGDI